MNSSPRIRGFDDFGGSIAQRFLEEVVPRHGEKIASADEAVQLTFNDLRRACLQLAHWLNAIAPPEKPVGLLIPNGALFPVATLACLVAGRPYVPIDPSYPALHIEAIIREAGLGALITESSDATVAAALPSLPSIDATSALRAGNEPCVVIAPPVGPAAILYTSGSTGRPKGVCYDQQAIFERVANATDAMQASMQDRFALVSSPTTISALYLPFTALLNGATLLFADARRLGINKVIQIFRDEGVTATFAVPVLLRELMGAAGAREAFSRFRALRTGGDVLVARDLGLWRSVLPSTCRVWISLTSTEMPAVFQWIVPRDWEPDGARLPVGYARPEIPFEVVDESGVPVSDGETGELVVKSRHLSLGYWQNGDLKAFATDPADSSVRIFHTGDLVRMRMDGLVEMVGRKDRQVKVRGFRVNLAEVEGVLRNCAGVAGAAVVPRREGEEVSALVAYVERKKVEDVDEMDLKDALAKRLPIHMRPRRIHFVDAIPLLHGFKVDVHALLEIDRQHSARAAADFFAGHLHDGPANKPAEALSESDAHDPVHIAVKEGWRTVLDQRSFDANTPFDDAGGDSLAALHLWSLIESALKAELSFDSLQLDMTPLSLVAAIKIQLTQRSRKRGAVSDKPQLFYMPTAEGDTFLQAQLRAGMGADVSCEIVRYPSTSDFLDSNAKFEAIVEAAVKQIVEKTDEPCNIIGYSFGGFVAWATACRLRELGRPLGLIGLIDSRSRDIPDQRRFRRFFADPIPGVVRGALRLTVKTGSIPILRKIREAVGVLPSGAAFRTHMYFIEVLRICAVRRWSPAVLDHPVCLFRSNELPHRPDFGWRKVCPRLEIVPIGGTHDSLLHRPDRDVLCRRIVEKMNFSSQSKTNSIYDPARNVLQSALEEVGPSPSTPVPSPATS